MVVLSCWDIFNTFDVLRVGDPCPISLSNSKLDVPYFSKREANLKIGGSIEGTLNVHGSRRLVVFNVRRLIVCLKD